MMARYSGQAATLYAALLILAGFALIGAGWRGAAATLFIPTQIAYAVSGGLAGIALIGTGASVLNVQASRIATAERSHRLDEMIDDTVDALAQVRGSNLDRGR